MYTGTTVLGEFSELQYSLSPSYQAARLLVIDNNETLSSVFLIVLYFANLQDNTQRAI